MPASCLISLVTGWVDHHIHIYIYIYIYTQYILRLQAAILSGRRLTFTLDALATALIEVVQKVDGA